MIQKGNSIDEGKIKKVIRLLGHGTPTEILKLYTRLFEKVNPESFTRKIRLMFSEGKLGRTNYSHNYYPNESIEQIGNQKLITSFVERS